MCGTGQSLILTTGFSIWGSMVQEMGVVQCDGCYSYLKKSLTM